jgi:hypothetical protein
MLPIQDMQIRHLGLTEEVAAYFYQAASVCLGRHHSSPVDFELRAQLRPSVTVTIQWSPLNQRILGAHANRDDATRDGAYACALAALEQSEQLFAIRRAEGRTGADYYVAPVGVPMDDFENFLRFEVSGIDATGQNINARLHKKVNQVRNGQINGNLPGLVGIVAFEDKLILLARA